MQKCKIFIVCHKKIDLPKIDGYSVIVPATQNVRIDGAIYDDCGIDNISEKNPNYSELSSLYCIWKNKIGFESRNIGLCHYRRYFGEVGFCKKPRILSVKSADRYLRFNDIILPFPNYWDTMSVRKQLVESSVDKFNYLQIRKVVQKLYPGYIPSYDIIMKGNTISICNMFVTKREVLNQYCEWLFSILFELEKYVVIDDENEYRKRIFGFIGERLLNVWVHKNKLKVKYLPITDINHNNLKYSPIEKYRKKRALSISVDQFTKKQIYLSDDLD